MTPHCPHFQPRAGVVNGVACKLHGDVSYRQCAIYCNDWTDTFEKLAFREWYVTQRPGVNTTVPTAEQMAMLAAEGKHGCGGCGL